MRIDVLGQRLAQPLLRTLVSCAVCGSLLGPPQPMLAIERGSPVAEEVLALVDKYYLDRSFNGVDLKMYKAKLAAKGALTDEQALDEAGRLLKKLGDRYTRILPPDKAGKLSKYDVTGVGINLVVADNGDVKVGAVPPAGSDALEQGVRFGDIVLAINGRETAGMTSFDALEAIQGEGEFVTMELTHTAGAKPYAVRLRKTFIEKNPVRYQLVESGSERLGYIKLKEFNAQCKRRIAEAVASLQKQGATRLVLDLRGNGGGVLDGALGIAGLFMQKPLVLYVTDANGAMQPLYSRAAFLSNIPLEVWVDGRTASSGEVLAAALHDNCRASLVGADTYGKGVIQGVFGLTDGGALIETVASYSTPAREEIDKKGVGVDEKHTFFSDAMGDGFVDVDVKAAPFRLPKVCKDGGPDLKGRALEAGVTEATL